MSFETVTIGPCTLYRGDSLRILEDGAFDGADAVISDPPYGISHVKGAGGKGMHTKRNITPIHGDDKPFDPSPWLRFSNVLLWGADHFRQRIPEGGRFLAWNKLGDKEPWDSFSDVEFAWHSHKGASRIISYIWKGFCNVKQGEHDGSGGVIRHHPTQKPLGVMAWSIEQAGTTEGDVIADPYMGAGSTGIAAIRTGRKFIGAEIEPRYFDIACRRIRRAWDLKCSELPFEKPEPLKQLELV